MRLICFVLLAIVFGTNGAFATVSTFKFTGGVILTADPTDFGLSLDENGGSTFFDNVVSGTLIVDMDAPVLYSDGGEYSHFTSYRYKEFSVSIGNKTFVRNAGFGSNEDVAFQDSVSPNQYNIPDVLSFNMDDVFDETGTLHAITLSFEALHDSADAFNGASLALLNDFNELDDDTAQFTDGFFALGEDYDNYQGNWFYNIRLVSVTAGVPEPATWLTMLSGFGLAGLIARRRRAHIASVGM